MTNIVTVSNGTFFTTATLAEVREGICSGMQWIELKSSGSLINLAHVVSIEDPNAEVELTTEEAREALEDDRRHPEPKCICITPTHIPECPCYTPPTTDAGWPW